MAGLIYELIAVLDAQSAIFSELYELAEQKKEFIIKNEVEKIRVITPQENILISKTHKLEKQRESISKDIADVLNIKKADMSMSYLAEVIKDQPEHGIFTESVARARDSLDKIKRINDSNKELIESALEYIDFSLNVMRSSMETEPTIYSLKGEAINNGKSSLDIKN